MTVRAPDRDGFNIPADVRRGRWNILPRWYSSLSSREQEENRILIIGDSLTQAGFVTAYENRFVHVFAEAQQTSYRPSNSQWYAITDWMSPWVGVGHTVWDGNGLGVNSWILSGTDTATLTVPSCDRFHAYFTGGTTTGDAEIRVNGTLVTTFDTTDTVLSVKRYDSGLLDMGPKVIEIKSSSATNVILGGLYAWNGDYGKGTHVWGVGHSGYTMGNIADNMLGRAGVSETSLAMAGEFLAPDLVILFAGINDLAGGTTRAQFKTDTAYCVDAIRSLTDGPDPSILILGAWARGDSTYTDAQWQPYREVLREVANEKACAHLDMYELGGWIGQVSDSFHPRSSVSSASTAFSVDEGPILRDPFDIGATVTGDGITGSRTIATIDSDGRGGTLSSAANTTLTGTAGLFISRRDAAGLTTDGIHPSDRGHRFLADELNRTLTSANTAAAVKIGVPYTRSKSLDQTTTGTTVTDDLHLWTQLVAGGEYNIELGLWVLPAATTTGPRITFTGPTMTSFKFNLNGPTGATSFGQASATALGTEVTLASLPSTTIPTMLTVNVHARPSASGYLKLRVGSEVSGNLVYQRGSWIRTTRVL